MGIFRAIRSQSSESTGAITDLGLTNKQGKSEYSFSLFKWMEQSEAVVVFLTQFLFKRRVLIFYSRLLSCSRRSQPSPKNIVPTSQPVEQEPDLIVDDVTKEWQRGDDNIDLAIKDTFEERSSQSSSRVLAIKETESDSSQEHEVKVTR
ncbi:unnamed protein product [Protopolystoma xenopodis]|uniref:Uncharacterized protein n=1 Tax=Protopolystoma xenopodis TaxID=117903 RepID=A0A448XBN1_9PLAT|nr:unnamed protein product [Protopolystoma xenopodis]